MLSPERRDSVVDFIPHLMGGHGPQFTGGDFDGEVHLALVADLHDGGIRPAISRQKVRDQLNRLLRCRKADAKSGAGA